MTVALQHPLWTEDIAIRDPWLEESPLDEPPGTIAIHWCGDGGGNTLLVRGNDADDFLERYRAGATFADRVGVLRDTIVGAISE